MKFLRKFNEHASYEAEVNRGGQDFEIPSVSYCKNVDDVHFNPYNLIEFYVGEITEPQTVKIYTDSSNSIDVTVSDGTKWYSYVLPKDKGLYTIESGYYSDEDSTWFNGIVKKVIVKADINFEGKNDYYTIIIPNSTIEASFKGSNTINVTNMEYMFYYCDGLTSLDLSGWDTSKVTGMYGMFMDCNALKTIRMVGCSTDTIKKITDVKPSSATIVTE